jgi:hypothetical protein
LLVKRDAKYYFPGLMHVAKDSDVNAVRYADDLVVARPDYCESDRQI